MTYILQMLNQGTVSGLAYSVSGHTLLSKSRVTVATASLIFPESSGKEVANGGTSLM
jgi:hypothetical protein